MAFPMFMHSYIIEITLPNSPSSPTKKYRLTDKGKDLLAKEGQEDME
jgi:DNA-binding PadR family transcriptional regulator